MIDWSGLICFGVLVLLPVTQMVLDHLHRQRLLDAELEEDEDQDE